jgi:uncharacterized membrane protein YfcA
VTTLILGLGLIAGIVTTLAGAGGGVFLIVTLSLVIGPHAALAASAPTLLVGNAHRLLLYRNRVERGVALRVISGALPASLLAGALTVSLPESVLHGLFLVVAFYAVARALGAFGWTPSRTWLAPAGAVVGGISATSGGAGLLLAPLLLASGLSGERYIATSAAVALATHVGRLAGYGSRGLLTHAVLGYAGTAMVSVVAGNLVGDKLRPYLDDRKTTLLEHGVLALCALLAVSNLSR